ncbi:glycosyltransferase [Paenibacillus favisporus]|uniref:glycosyltransferase n=1 Tax=Paenibacillus favisporus TaxID=221028 RepID=UPI003D2CF6A8
MEIIYSKYNRERLPEFQTETTIYYKDGKKFARKKALTKQAETHIQKMFQNYLDLRNYLKSVNLTKPQLEDNKTVVFQFVNEPTLDSLLFNAVSLNDRDLFFYYLNGYKNILFKHAIKHKGRLIADKDFIVVFGNKVSFMDVECFSCSNIDLTFDNITFDGTDFTILDYEWVFNFEVPVIFVMYRSLNEFFGKYNEQVKSFISKDAVLDLLGIPREYYDQLEEMEENFQSYVFGGDYEFKYGKQVEKEYTTYTMLMNKLASLTEQNESNKREIDSLNDKVKNIQQEVIQYKNKAAALCTVINEKDSIINEKTASILAQKTLINQMDIQLKNREAHINQLLEKERTLENIYNSGGWALLNSYYKLRDAIIPAKSKRRVLAKLTIKTLKNPKFMFSKLNKENIKKLKYYFKAEDASQLENRIETFIERNNGEESHPEIQLFANEDLKHLKFDHVENPLVSIIIPVYNQWNYTYSCLASILENTKDTSYEVIIADDMSTDETINIQNYVDNVRVVRDGTNRGFLLNCNNAAKQARGKYIFFLNNDTNVQPEWLSSLVQLIESDSKIGMVGSKLIYPDGRQQEAGGIIWDDASGWNFGRLDDPEKPEYNYVKEVDYISGAAILIRHDLWKEIGGFDERFVPAYFEDSDLAFEVRRLGYKVLFQPRSVVVHFEGISHGTDLGSGIKSYQVQNKEKFLNKWNSVLTTQHFPNAEHVFWARDRSRGKKTVVIVDHYVPHYDKDAGGRCTYFYIRLMVSMGLHVIFIGDNFYRHEPYTTELQQMGVEVLYGNDHAKNINKWIKTNGQYLDYVYLNRPHISIKYMDVFKKHTNAKVIYFGHDLHYLREMRNYEITKNPSVLKSVEEWKETEFKLFEMADVIHVVGSFEKQVLFEQFPHKPIRNIPLFPYSEPYGEKHSIDTFEERKDLLFVGGFNHKPNFDGIMWFIKNAFPKIRNEIKDIKLFIIGSNPPDELKEMQSEQIIITGYVSDQELEEYYNRCRVVVVPLRFGAGVKGKVIEALNYQVPIVTTSIGAEGLEDIQNVLLVSDEEDQFATSVINLYLNEELWNSLSISSGEYIQKYFTIEAAKSILSLDIEN